MGPLFTARPHCLQSPNHARNADRCNSYGRSVYLSVRPSRSGVLSRRLKYDRAVLIERQIGQSF